MPLNVQPDPVEHSALPSGVRNRLQRYDWAIARPETILKLEVVEDRAVKMCPEGAFIAGHLRMAGLGGAIAILIRVAVLQDLAPSRDPPLNG